MDVKRRYPLLVALVSSQLLLATSDAIAAKRALIVTIGEYAAETGWKSIASNKDLPLMQHALMKQGFAADDIVHLPQEEATRAGIVAAIRKHLIEPAKEGNVDVAVFHYSGHGQQITDNNRDEIDGYDEALVPYDAPEQPAAGYGGEKHFRDDDFGALLYELRKEIGPDGDVLVFLDSCYSGTGTRGGGYPDPVRGTLAKIGPPQQSPAGERGLDRASGIVDASASTRGGENEDSRELAPMTVFSAETHNRLAEETTDGDGSRVGALSWVLSRALLEANENTSYRDLFETIKRRTAEKNIPNNPQAEGDLDRLLFAGQAVEQVPFFRVTTLNLDEGWAAVEGGGLVGLLQGSEVEVHKTGARRPSSDTLIAKGVIEAASSFTSEVVFTDVVDRDADSGVLFVTAPSFGLLKVNVFVDAPADAAWRDSVVTTLEREAARQHSMLVMLDSAPDGLVANDASRVVLIREITSGPPSRRGVMLETWETGQPLLPQPIRSSNSDLAIGLLARIKKYAQNSYLRALNVQSPGMEVAVDLVPCKLQCTSNLQVCGGESCSCIEEGDPKDLFDEGNDLRMSMGTGFGIRLKNIGTKAVYASVLDLMPDGSIATLWPVPGTSVADTRIEGGTAFRIPDPGNSDLLLAYRACPPFGTDVIKVIGTTEPVDFGPITRGQTITRGGGAPGPLDALFEDSLSGTRGVAPTFAAGSVSTADVILTVDESD